MDLAGKRLSWRVKLRLFAFGVALSLFAVFADFVELLDAIPDSMPEPLQMILGGVILPLWMLSQLSFLAGPVLVAAVGWSVVHSAVPCGRFLSPLVTPVFGALYLASLALPFLGVPEGTWIRPMGWAFFSLLAAAATAGSCIALSAWDYRNGKSKVMCIAAGVLSIPLIAVPALSLHAAAWYKGFHLSP